MGLTMNVSRLLPVQPITSFSAPCFTSQVAAGFPSPADDHMDKALDLNELLIRSPSATFYCRVSGDSMTGVGIFNDDILIVDRALKPCHGDVVLAALDGELTCKILDMHGRRLLAANRDYHPILIKEGMDFLIEGVIISSIRRHRCLP
jgi:DNA polymerase V